MQPTTLSPAVPTSSFGHTLAGAVNAINRALSYLAPIADLVARLWVANAFFKSGLTKIESFSTTLQLFQYEYSVPLLPPVAAAYLGTFVELFFPVLLALGLGGRLAASVLFVFNIIAVISYPELGEAGLKDHYVWGILFLMTVAHGPGKISLDALIAHFFNRDRA
jgi:putative oxidoreductase